MLDAHFSGEDATAQLAQIAKLLNQIGTTTLQMQVMVDQQQRESDLLQAKSVQMGKANAGLAVGPVTSEALGNLQGVARHFLQNSVPRSRTIIADIVEVAYAASQISMENTQNLSAALADISARLDQRRAVVQGFAGALPVGLGVIRMGEQRLWALLIDDLQEREGVDGPLMEIANNLETNCFELSANCRGMVGKTNDATRDVYFGKMHQIGRILGPLAPKPSAQQIDALLQDPEVGEAAELARKINEDYNKIAQVAPVFALSLAVALRASTYLQIAVWLEEDWEELGQRLTRLARDYRLLSRRRSKATVPAGWLTGNIPGWSATVIELQAMLRYCENMPERLRGHASQMAA